MFLDAKKVRIITPKEENPTFLQAINGEGRRSEPAQMKTFPEHLVSWGRAGIGGRAALVRVTFHRQLFSVKLKGNSRLEGLANNPWLAWW